VAEFLIRRLLISSLVLTLVSVLVFAALRLLPGDPARVMAGTEADDAGLAAVREKYGLDDPIPVQYGRWVALAARGDLGESIRTRLPVAAVIVQKLPITVELALLSLLFALAVALPMGVLSAARKNSAWDWLANAVSLSGVSIPNFWLGILLILLFSVYLRWLPASGFIPFGQDPLRNLTHMLMPVVALGTRQAAVLMRQTRNAVIEALASDYVRTARAKGLASRSVLLRHALRNSLIPVVTMLGLQAGALIGGAVVTELIFVIPGFGRLILEAVFNRDYPMVQGVILLTASGYVLINLLVDVSYSLVNPRIRVAGGPHDR
jgi:peptide/nickel transport system permease protein